MTKKFKKIITFLIIIIIIMIFILINNILSLQNSLPNKITTLQQTLNLSNDIFYLTEDNYPDNPYDVLSLYLDAYSLIYGDFISNQEVVSILLQQQRLLLDDVILNDNSLEQQQKYLFNNLDYLIQNDFKIISITIEEPYFISDDTVVIKAIKVDNQQEIYNFKYYLKKNPNGYWKIVNWENDNDKYTIQNYN